MVSLEPQWEHNLRQALSYCMCANTGECRRAVMAMHFGEAPPMCRYMCDTCVLQRPGKEASPRDMTALGQVKTELITLPSFLIGGTMDANTLC
eukprot:scaffold677030_cov61-Prasinocladus_malaysianus.AAC.1